MNPVLRSPQSDSMSNGLEPGHGKADVEPIELLRLHASTRGLDEGQLNQLAADAEVVRIREGQTVLTDVFGSGLTAGAMVFRR